MSNKGFSWMPEAAKNEERKAVPASMLVRSWQRLLLLVPTANAVRGWKETKKDRAC